MLRLAEHYKGKANASNAEEAFEILKEYGNSDREMFFILHMNSRNNLITNEIVAVGTLDRINIHPREIFKRAILQSSASIILAHNHPSGDVNPSQEDLDMTKKMKEVSKIVGITILDHIVFSGKEYYSMLNHGGMEIAQTMEVLLDFYKK